MSEDPDILLSRIGLRIAQRRQHLGLTQKQLAEQVGMQQGNVARIEHGEQNVTIRTLVKFAEALGTTAVELLGGAPATKR